jgi:hypothetical protein
MNVKVNLEYVRRVTKVVIKKLGRQRKWGEADHSTGIIYIDPRATGIKHLEMILHESIHIIQPYLHEEAVIDVGAELTRVLWEQGYRKYDNDASIPLQDETEEE